MAKLSDLISIRHLGRGRYEAELPGFGRFEGDRAASATDALLSAFRAFHLMDDDSKVAYIPCNDGQTLFHCWATPHGWAYRIVKLADGRVSCFGVESREGETRTWKQFLTRMRTWAADYDGTVSAAKAAADATS